MTISRLSDEVKIYILSFMEPRTIAIMARINHEFARLARDKTLWKTVYDRRWHLAPEAKFSLTLDWKTYFRKAQSFKEEKNYRFFWREGVPLEAIHFFTAGEEAFSLDVMQAVLGGKPITDEALVQILQLLNVKDHPSAFSVFLKHRQTLIRSNPHAGWWLSRIFSRSLGKLTKDQMIFLPEKFNLPNFHDFLLGVAHIWLEQGRWLELLVTLNCYGQLVTEEMGGELLSFQRFIEECQRSKPSWQLLEALGDILDSFNKKEEAIDLYIQALHPEVCMFPRDEVRLATKIGDLLIALKQKHSDQIPSEDALELVLEIFENHMLHKTEYDLEPVLTLLGLALTYKLENYYQILLDIPTRTLYNSSKDDFFPTYFFFRCQLCKVTKNQTAGIEAWVEFCHTSLLSSSDYRIIYLFLKDDLPACHTMLRYQREIPQVQLGVAYAHFRLNNIDQALRIISANRMYIRKEDLAWLFFYSKTNINAAVIYSLFLNTRLELIQFYTSLLDYSHREFFIYHNLATRLFFIHHKPIREIVKYVKMAQDHDPDIPESYILKAKCYQKLGKPEKSLQSLSKARELKPRKFSSNPIDYSQDELLLLYRT